MHSLVLLFILLAASASSANVTHITLVEDPWPPYIEGKLGEEVTGGSLVKLYKRVFEQIESVQVSYHLMPWKRALLEVEQGKQDGIMALFETQERLKVMDFSDPIFTGRTMLWYSSLKFPMKLNWNTYDDLSPYHIIMLRGSAMAQPLLDAQMKGTPLTITEVNSHPQQFDVISRGRADITVLTEIVGHHLLNTGKYSGRIVPMDKPLTADDVYYLAFSKKSPARKLIPRINSIIASMRKSGELDRILKGAKE